MVSRRGFLKGTVGMAAVVVMDSVVPGSLYAHPGQEKPSDRKNKSGHHGSLYRSYCVTENGKTECTEVNKTWHGDDIKVEGNQDEVCSASRRMAERSCTSDQKSANKDCRWTYKSEKRDALWDKRSAEGDCRFSRMNVRQCLDDTARQFNRRMRSVESRYQSCLGSARSVLQECMDRAQQVYGDVGGKNGH
jgi:hypothetical protein